MLQALAIAAIAAFASPSALISNEICENGWLRRSNVLGRGITVAASVASSRGMCYSVGGPSVCVGIRSSWSFAHGYSLWFKIREGRTCAGPAGVDSRPGHRPTPQHTQRHAFGLHALHHIAACRVTFFCRTRPDQSPGNSGGIRVHLHASRTFLGQPARAGRLVHRSVQRPGQSGPGPPPRPAACKHALQDLVHRAGAGGRAAPVSKEFGREPWLPLGICIPRPTCHSRAESANDWCHLPWSLLVYCTCFFAIPPCNHAEHTLVRAAPMWARSSRLGPLLRTTSGSQEIPARASRCGRAARKPADVHNEDTELGHELQARTHAAVGGAVRMVLGRRLANASRKRSNRTRSGEAEKQPRLQACCRHFACHCLGQLMRECCRQEFRRRGGRAGTITLCFSNIPRPSTNFPGFDHFN
jgi:hypothetical protein